LNDSEIEKFRFQLLQVREDLLQIEVASKQSGETVELDQAKVGRISRMDAMQAQQMALETGRRRKLHLQKIESALRRIDSDNFGYCLTCDEEIDSRRLKVDPTNSKCIVCADL